MDYGMKGAASRRLLKKKHMEEYDADIIKLDELEGRIKDREDKFGPDYKSWPKEEYEMYCEDKDAVSEMVGEPPMHKKMMKESYKTEKVEEGEEGGEEEKVEEGGEEEKDEYEDGQEEEKGEYKEDDMMPRKGYQKKPMGMTVVVTEKKTIPFKKGSFSPESAKRKIEKMLPKGMADVFGKLIEEEDED